MFIELTDLLRCPADHDGGFLVLVPDRMAGRRAIAGTLGCPACGWTTTWSDGVPTFGSPPGEPPRPDASPAFDAEAAVAFLGLTGPGGWLALAGGIGGLAHRISRLLPGVHLVAINPPATLAAEGEVSVIRAASWPLKREVLRGVVIGEAAGEWTSAAIASVLPGLHAVGEGLPPVEDSNHALLAATSGAWVVQRRHSP